MARTTINIPDAIARCLEEAYGVSLRRAVLLFILETLSGVIERREFSSECIRAAERILGARI